MVKAVTSTNGYLSVILREMRKLDSSSTFYRGHSSKRRYKVQPSLFRSSAHLKNEHRLYRELLIANPSDFSGDITVFERLVRMQHYSMPTRMLDLTSNPLVALYFACKSNQEESGEVLIVTMKNYQNLKYFDSDTVGCLANLAQMPFEDKESIKSNLTLPKTDFNQKLEVRRLLHFIRQERPYFEPKIIPDDLKKVVCVKGRLSNDRVYSQSGAFLLFGLGGQVPEAGNSDFSIQRILVGAKNKSDILSELDQLNINERTLFPYIESSARYFTKKMS